MNRLQAQLQRLYPSHPAAGEVRALVLELAAPADWTELSKVWQGVQMDLDLPAPAIAVSGIDAYQLWFSLAEPVPAARAQAFLESLCRRYLAGVAPERIRIQQAGTLPPAQVAPERWSAFVAADLAPLFTGEPWLDHPPGADAQADLLSRVQGTKPEAFLRALAQLDGSGASPAAKPAIAAPSARPGAFDSSDPRRFLLSVMQDPAVDLHLRIEAAKALLPHVKDAPSR